jgi:hypothetical protein
MRKRGKPANWRRVEKVGFQVLSLRQLVTFCPDVLALTTVQAEIPRKFRRLPAAAAKHPNLETLSSRLRAAK